VIKDAILRYKRLAGYKVHDQPGYDTHGLPIEVAVEKLYNIKNKQEIQSKIGIENFIMACKDFALKNAKGLTESFKDVGVFMDWENPYYTFDKEYISNSWFIIKKSFDRGLLEIGEDVLHWCPRCETVLADYEVSEYRDIEDPSIYVKFKVRGTHNKYLLIWTTTPWTIPANVFVMINGNVEYAEVQVKDEIYIVALSRIRDLFKEIGISEYKILRVVKGSELVGLEYEHPLEDLVPAQHKVKEFHKVIDAGNFVSTYEGTGLVHSAPGHGDIDFQIGTKNGMPTIMLVDDQGKFNEDAGKYKGIYVRDASELIIEDLRKKGALLYATKIVHRYPVCWRCKTPLILRAVKQWFIRVTKLKEELLDAINKVKWIPEWGKSRIENLVKELRDWVISRQRFWGIPLPIWICSKCGNVMVIGSIEELKKVSINGVPEDPHKPWIDKVIVKCSKCGGEAKRVPDVADVWFDSGVAFFASLGRGWLSNWEKYGPVDLVLEGHDQLRGWFFSLLRTSIIGFDKPPYVSVLVHGFMLDEQGREMHKSLGNYVEPQTVIEKYGRDVLRLWLLRNTTWEDVRFSWKNIELSKRDLQIVWNVYNFASTYMSLDNFDPTKIDEKEIRKYLRIEDRWILSRFYSMLKKTYQAMEDYKIHELANNVFTFIIEDVSRFYLKIVRKRAWVEENTPDKLALYYTLYKILSNWIILASIVTPFIAEKIYSQFVVNKKLSVSMESLPKVEEEFIDIELEKTMELVKKVLEASLNARSKAGIKLRWPLKKIVIFLKEEEYIKKLLSMKELLLNILNCKEVEIFGIDGYKLFGKVKAQPNPSTIGSDFKRLSKAVMDYIIANSYTVAEDIINKNFHKVILNGNEITILPKHVNIIEESIEGFVTTRNEFGGIAINKEISEEEEEEGIVRDLVRRIQLMRKLLNLNVTDYITVSIKLPVERSKILDKYVNYIKNEVRAKNIESSEEVKGELVRSWDIEGEEYVIGISKA